MPVVGIPSTRVSDLFVRQRLMNQVQDDQVALYRLQTQLSTGRKFELPSEAPIAAQRIIGLQRLLGRKDQVQNNLNTNQTFLNMTDTALGQVSSLMAETRGTVMSVFGTTATDIQRQAVAQQVEQALRQLVDTGNQKFRGRYLFTGSDTTVQPFSLEDQDGSSVVRYEGNEKRLSSFSNLDLLFDTNLQGNEVFGAISEPVRGNMAFTPSVNRYTRLADLRGGRGITRGTIAISDGTNTSFVDLSHAETVGDIAALIHSHPPAGNTVNVDITPRGLVIQLAAGSLTIEEVGGGTTATELGILTRTGVGTTPVTSADLNPRVAATTKLADILGSRAMAVVRPAGTDNDMIIRGAHRGADLNGVAIQFIDDGSVVGNAATASYNAATKTLKVRINDGYTEARTVVKAINDANALGTVPFTAELDFLDAQMGGVGVIDSTTVPPATTKYGSLPAGFAAELDQASGLTIRNNGTNHVIDISHDTTVEDMLNTLNNSTAGVVAEINADGTGIDVRSRLSGIDFAIGENGGNTATQLGLRTFVDETKLADLSFGRGVQDYQGPGTKAHVTLQALEANNDLVFEALGEGPQWNGYQVEFVDAGPGPATSNWDPVNKRLTFGIVQGKTTANDIIAMLDHTLGARDLFRLSLDQENGSANTGQGPVKLGSWTTAGGCSANTDFSITRADGVTFEIDVHNAKTVGDIIDRINTNATNVGSGVPVVARLAANGNGIELVDNSMGSGRLTVTRAMLSTAAIDLGLIPAGQESQTPTAPGARAQSVLGSVGANNDLLIQANGNGTQTNGVRIVVKDNGLGPGNETISYDPVARTLTLGITAGATRAVDLVNLASQNPPPDPQAAALFNISLNPTDGAPNDGTGLVDLTVASTVLGSAGANNDLRIQANANGLQTNGVKIVVVDNGLGAGNETINYNPVAGTLTFGITAGATRAIDLVNLANSSPPPDPQAAALFNIGLNSADGAPNNGTGLVDLTVPGSEPAMAGGSQPVVAGGVVDVLTGTDVNSQETEGLFTALIKIHDALLRNDMPQLEHAVAMLDGANVKMNFSRAELGARQQGLDVLQKRLDNEEVELKQTLSLDYDVDLAETISSLTAKQVAYDAALKSTAQISHMSLLNYL